MTQEELQIRRKRNTVLAAKDIIEFGLDRYYEDGIRFGFFEVGQDQKTVLENVIANLIELNELEWAEKLKEFIK